MKKAVLLLVVICLCAWNGVCVAEELPQIYQASVLETALGQPFVLNDTIECTVEAFEFTTQTEALDMWQMTPFKDFDDGHVLKIDMTIENIGQEVIRGEDIVSGFRPILFIYPLTEEDKLEVKEDYWRDWAEFVSGSSFNPEYEFNDNRYEVCIVEKNGNLGLLKDAEIHPGERVSIVDIKGSLSMEKSSRIPVLLGYEVLIESERVRVLLTDMQIDFNDISTHVSKEFIDAIGFKLWMVASDVEYLFDYAHRWDEKDGIDKYHELTLVCQEIFGLETTGVFDHTLYNYLSNFLCDN